MTKETYATKMVEQKTCINNEVICDYCGDTIYNYQDGEYGEYSDRDVEFYEVMTSHNDWGNDSVDSIKHMEVCKQCAIDAFNEYLCVKPFTTHEIEFTQVRRRKSPEYKEVVE